MYEDLAECLIKPENLTQIVLAIETDKLLPFETGGRIKKRKSKLTFKRVKSEEEQIYFNIPKIIIKNKYWLNKLENYIIANINDFDSYNEKHPNHSNLKKDILKFKANKKINIKKFKNKIMYCLQFCYTPINNLNNHSLSYHIHDRGDPPSEGDLIFKTYELVISYYQKYINFHLIHNYKSKKILTIRDIYKTLKQAS